MVLKDKQRLTIFTITIKTEKLRQIQLLEIPLIFSEKQPISENLTPIEGIRKYGPYDLNCSQTLKRKFNGVEFFVFYPKGEKIVLKRLSKLMSFLKSGYYEKRSYIDQDFNGLAEEFRLKNTFIPEEREFRGYEPGNLFRELEDWKEDLEQIFKRGNRPIVIIGGTSHRSVTKNRSQYIEAKRIFTELDFPCQYASFYQYEKETSGAGILYNVGRKDRPFGHSLWNFALNIYGKIGGLAWVVRQKLSEDDEKVIDLTIGLRFVRSRDRKGFHVGYATILDRFGKLVGIVSSSPFKIEKISFPGMVVPEKIMKEIISKALKNALNDPRIKEIYSKKGSINVAIHRVGSLFHKKEIYGISQGIKSTIKEYANVKYGLISVIKRSPALVFNRRSPRFNVIRRTAIGLNDITVILYTTGPTDTGSKSLISYPITIISQNLGEEKSPFESLEEICNHVFSLTNLHWQTVVPGSVRLPASLEFAQDIARLSSFGIEPKKDSWLWETLWFV